MVIKQDFEKDSGLSASHAIKERHLSLIHLCKVLTTSVGSWAADQIKFPALFAQVQSLCKVADADVLLSAMSVVTILYWRPCP